MMKRSLAWILMAALSPGLLTAQNSTAAASLAFPSIQAGAGARAIALGSTYVGIDEGSAALLWNPAGLSSLADPELALHHDAALVGGTQDIAILGLPLGRANGLGLSVNYEDDGIFDGRNSSGQQVGTYSVRTYGGSVGWGIGVPGGLSLGVTGKFNHQDLAGTGFDAFAGDLGLLWRLGPQLSVGAAYSNFGPDVAGSHLAQGLRAGISSYSGKGEDYQLLLALSGESLTYGPSSIHLGLEETLYHLLAVRAGYAADVPTDASVDNTGLLGWTFGVGLMLHSLCVDYAYVPMSDLGGVQRVSVTYGFGGTCAVAAAPVATPAPTAAPTPARVRTPEPTMERTPELIPVATRPVRKAHPAAKVGSRADKRERAPAVTKGHAEALDLELLLTDVDFMHPKKGSERERLTLAAQKRVYKFLVRVSGKPGATLTVDGETEMMKHPYGNDNAAELREIGNRRSSLVRSFVRRKMSKARLSSRVTLGSDKGSPASIFQIVLR